MNEQPTKTFTDAVVACLCRNSPTLSEDTLRPLVAWVLGEAAELSLVHPDRKPLRNEPTRADIESYLAEIRAILPKEHDRIALVNGGATKIKGYVFESSKLPEIRGASALLDWVNNIGLRNLWRRELKDTVGSEDTAEKCIIYASGGGFLAFAPAAMGDQMATEVERCYTEHTLTANSVAVSETFSLLELRYGRLSLDADGYAPFWVEDFEQHWNDAGLRPQLASNYYGKDNETPAERFFRRKSFGELVTLLSTMTSRRREERAYAGEPRSVPFYQMLPWAEKCDSSDIRPAVLAREINGEQRHMSEASARKRYVGQRVKKEDLPDEWFTQHFEWKIPQGLQDRSWEQQWENYVSKSRDQITPSSYAQFIIEHGLNVIKIKPAHDVGEIAQASDPDRYIGVIYADGNNVGRLIATLKTPEEYAATSHILSEAAKDAVFAALAEHLTPAHVRSDKGEPRWVHPFEILTIGGDDLLLIVPGNRALDIALTIGRNFETMLADSQRQPAPSDALSSYQLQGRYASSTSFVTHPYTPSIGLSAGVIIAQENSPIFFLRDLAEELLKNAKKLARKHADPKDENGNLKPQYFGGAIDFMVMKSITMVAADIKSFRRQALGDDGADSKRRLIARPYTWHEFAGLLDTVRALKQARVPRSQLYRLRRTLDAEPGNAIAPSVMEYLYTRTRLSPVYGEALQTHIEQPWCWQTPVDQRSSGLPPWMPLSKQGWETIWPDMLEVYEMVPTEEQP